MRRTYRPLLLGLLPALALLGAGCGDDAQGGSATTTSRGGSATTTSTVGSATTTTMPAAVEADTSWGTPLLSADGMALELRVGSRPEGDGPCEQRFRHQVIETNDDVTIAFDLLELPAETTTPAVCPANVVPQDVRIVLDAPLGDRQVYDGVQTQPKDVGRLAEVVVPEVLPDGITIDDVTQTPRPDAGPLSWSQAVAVPSGPGWALFIDQGPIGSFTSPSTEPGTVIDTIEVHGNEAKVYEYFDDAGYYARRMVQWTEGGLDITVRAELLTASMAEPHSFANPDVAFIADTLVRVADGIVVP